MADKTDHLNRKIEPIMHCLGDRLWRAPRQAITAVPLLGVTTAAQQPSAAARQGL